MAFIRQPAPLSLYEWRISDDFTENDGQLEKLIRSVSKGLVEVKTREEEAQDKGLETISICAGAGSLNLEHGDTRVVQVIHESVREFFLQNNGFSALDPSFESNPIGYGHLSIMATCLDYLNMSELDALVQARNLVEQCEKDPSGGEESPGAKYYNLSMWRSPSTSSVDISRHRNAQDNERSGVPPGSPPSPQGPEPYRTARAQGPEPYGARRYSPPRCNAMHKYYERTTSPSSRRIRRRAEEAPVSETLKNISDSATHINIIRWLETLATDRFAADQISPNKSPCNSPTHPSVTGQSQVLEDDTALLSYATFELFTHARLAHVESADPTRIINRLMEKQTWARWVTLREDVPRGVELLHYAAGQGLSSWISKISGDSMAGVWGLRVLPEPSLIEAACKDNREAPGLVLGNARFDKSSKHPKEWSMDARRVDIPRQSAADTSAQFLSANLWEDREGGTEPLGLSVEGLIYQSKLPNPNPDGEGEAHSWQRRDCNDSWGKPTKRRRSVASFSSASSHIGSNEVLSRATIPLILTADAGTAAKHRRVFCKDGSQDKVAISKPTYQRPKHDRVFCKQCESHPEGFRSEHELRRHQDREHTSLVKKWVCIKPTGHGHPKPELPLSKCKACGPQQKKYGAYYNAAAHLRRTHFKPKAKGQNKSTKVDDVEKRGGKGGGDWPPMSELKYWMKEVEEPVTEYVTSTSQEGIYESEDETIDTKTCEQFYSQSMSTAVVDPSNYDNAFVAETSSIINLYTNNDFFDL